MEPLLPENYYHIYNHANSHEDLFLDDRNYVFFLEKYKKHIVPVVNTYAFCLMPNHFHFVVKIKNGMEIIFNKKEKKLQYNKLMTYDQKDDFISKYVSKQFSNLFSSYTQSFNKENSRKGSLFLKIFRRKQVTDDKYFIKLINYIHFNPVVHGFVYKIGDWKYSSYNSILSNKPTLIKRKELLEWFDGLENFVSCHQSPMEI